MKQPQQPKPQPLQHGISAAILPADNGKMAIAIILGVKNTITTTEGNVIPGLGLEPSRARELGHLLLYLAQAVDNGTGASPVVAQAPVTLAVQ